MTPLDLLGYGCVLISLTGIALNAKKNILCWPIWILSNVGWITYSILGVNYPYVVLWVIFLFSNVYGWQQWHKTNKKNKHIKEWENLANYTSKRIYEGSEKGNNKIVTTPKPEIYPAPQSKKNNKINNIPIPKNSQSRKRLSF